MRVDRLGAALLVIGVGWASYLYLTGRHDLAAIALVVASAGLAAIGAAEPRGAA